MGLCVFGRTDSQLMQLANSVVAEKRTHQLRIATVDDVVSLAELVEEGHISADEAVALLKPGGVFVADAVKLLARIAARATDAQAHEPTGVKTGTAINDAASTYEIEPVESSSAVSQPSGTKPKTVAISSTERIFLMTPVSDEGEVTAQETIASLLNAGWYVFADKTPGRKRLKPGDGVCFYESGVGVVAEAEVVSAPEEKPPSVEGIAKNLDKFHWSFRLTNARFFFEHPVVIDADLRSRLDAFAERDPSQPWSWFVQGTKIITEHDFDVLTGRLATE